MTRREEKVRMKMNFLRAFVLALFIIPLFPYVSSADYLIELKNGRSIDVREYKDEGEQIRFTSYGGETVINKSLIKEIKKTDLTPVEGPVYYEENGIEKPAAPAKDEKATTVPSSKNEPDSIQKQKEALSKEGEELEKKREQLLNDIKQEGRLVLPTKRKELKKRMDTLEGEIKEFNEKAKDVEKIEKPVEGNIEAPEKKAE
jgi:hypothetical protein